MVVSFGGSIQRAWPYCRNFSTTQDDRRVSKRPTPATKKIEYFYDVCYGETKAFDK